MINWRDAAVDRKASTVSLGKAGMGLDLGFIAKGYPADEAAPCPSRRSQVCVPAGLRGRFALTDSGFTLLP